MCVTEISSAICYNLHDTLGAFCYNGGEEPPQGGFFRAIPIPAGAVPASDAFPDALRNAHIIAEDTADVAVQSAPLERSAATRNGMVRVRLLSIGSNPASLTVTAVGAMAVSGGQTMALANGEKVSISHSSATGEIRLTRGGETVSMGREMALRRRQTDGGFRIAQARRPQNVYPGDLHLVSKLESGTYRLYVVANVYIESYLYGVVPYEMGSSSALEALKAQAVAARTYTVRAMNANASKVYDSWTRPLTRCTTAVRRSATGRRRRWTQRAALSP